MDYVGEGGFSAQNVITSQILSICLRRKNRVTQAGVQHASIRDFKMG